ncbi:hypothetical protein Tsubulata_032815 [Turnera subulata]|uniref:Diacylglycerol O-acyltransferase n=1 Tax=Turnera subulata TaxID=218843 RepID=A0A9Q0GEW8_9ROSI|nr:hypothetical protein Tsubulata_032815 [Turnera subulata]
MSQMANKGDSSCISMQQEPLSPAAQLFHAPRLSCCIVALMGFKTSIDPIAIKEGLSRTLIKHPRFSCKLVTDQAKKMKWERTIVNVEDHIVAPKLEDIEFPGDQFVEDYITHLTTIPMDLSKPLWEFHILNVKTSDAESVGVFRIHHSMGDGASLISLLLACSRKTSDPLALPTVPTQKRAASGTNSGGVENDVEHFGGLGFALGDHDTTTPLRGAAPAPPAGSRELKHKRIVYRIVSLDDMKQTINDVATGMVQAGLSRYLDMKYGENKKNKDQEGRTNTNLPKAIRLRAVIAINLRPTGGIQALADLMAKESTAKWGWGNWAGGILLPFTIALRDNPLDYLLSAKAKTDRKIKQSLECIVTFHVAAALVHSVVRNTTLIFSNVVGPVEEISFCGHPLAFLSPAVYGQTQPLIIHLQSYNNKMMIVLAVDPDVIPDPHRLCDFIQESLKNMKDAVLDKGSDAV